MRNEYFNIILLTIFYIWCKSPYEKFYHPEQTVKGNDRYVQPKGKPKVYGYSENGDGDNRLLMDDWFVLIGYYLFRY